MEKQLGETRQESRSMIAQAYPRQGRHLEKVANLNADRVFRHGDLGGFDRQAESSAFADGVLEGMHQRWPARTGVSAVTAPQSIRA